MDVELLKQGQSIQLTEAYSIAFINKQDLPEITCMLNDPSVTEFLYFAPVTPEIIDGYFGPIIENTGEAIRAGAWPRHPTIVVKDHENRFMGMCGLEAVAMHRGNFEIGYQLPVYAWRKGIATEACKFMTVFAFEVFDAHKVAADCYFGNIGSKKTLEKCGYVQEGVQKDYYKLDSGFDDKVLYGMTAEQYRQIYR